MIGVAIQILLAALVTLGAGLFTIIYFFEVKHHETIHYLIFFGLVAFGGCWLVCANNLIGRKKWAYNGCMAVHWMLFLAALLSGLFGWRDAFRDYPPQVIEPMFIFVAHLIVICLPLACISIPSLFWLAAMQDRILTESSMASHNPKNGLEKPDFDPDS